MTKFLLAHWTLNIVLGIQGSAEGNVNTNQSIVSRLISVANRRSGLIVLFDEINEQSASEIGSRAAMEQCMLLFGVANIGTFLKQHLQHVLQTSTSTEDIRNSLNFLVVCDDCLHSIVDVISATGDKVEQQALRHFSTWLFITKTDVTLLHTSVDNIAHIKVQDTDNLNNQTESDEDLLTLQWMPEGRRWSAVNIFSLSDDDVFHHVFPNVQRGLNGACLLVSTLQWVPQTIRKLVNGSVMYVGASIDVITSLSVVFNFTFQLVEPTDGSWGVQLDNGSWTGIVGMIERQEADMTGVSYASSAGRAQIMAFTPPYQTMMFVVIYTKKKNAFFFWKFLIGGFKWDVYVCGTAVFLCSIPVYSYIIHMSQHYQSLEKPQLKWNIVFVFTSIALRQDVSAYRKPNPWSERLLIFSWAFFCFLITAIYSGSLVASATVDKVEIPFNTLEELVNQNEYTITVFEGHVALEIVKNSKLDVYQKLYNKTKGHILNTNDYLTEGLNLVLNKRHALLCDLNVYQAMRARSCELSVMKERLFYSPVSLGFLRHSPLTKLFHARWMSDTGILAANLKNWQDDPKQCEQKLSPDKLELNHLKALFVICGFGLISGVLVLLFERLQSQRNSSV